jgi:hypothetical protein
MWTDHDQEGHMSEQERFESEEGQEDVEAHKKKAVTDDPTASGDDSADDFEAHKKKALTDDPTASDDDSTDDFEAHSKKAL